MPRSRDTIRSATLCVPNDVLGSIGHVAGDRKWKPIQDHPWSATRVLVTMIPENRVGGCLLGATRGEAVHDAAGNDNAIVTAARRAVGRWLNAAPATRGHETQRAVEARNLLRAQRLESFEAVGRLALAGHGEWVRPIGERTGRKPRASTVQAVAKKVHGGRRDRQYFALRCGDLPVVLVGRNSRYGRIIESSDPWASPPAQWDISASFVHASEPLGETLEARLRALEKIAGIRAPFVTALRAVVNGVTASLWQKAVIDAETSDYGFRSNGQPRRPKINGRKLGEALLPPVPLIARRKVGGWYVSDRR
nr:MAG TPA: hypothetical protein [Caudoviricetes sp.]